MSFRAELEASRLSVLLDLRHPFAYLALPAAIELGASENVAINWLPLSTPPLHPPTEARAEDGRGVRHRRYRANALVREIEAYASAQGLELREYYRDVPPDAANLGWLWVRDRQPDILEACLTELFRAYWAVELDAASGEQVAELLDRHGADGSSFLEWCRDDGRAAAALLDEELRSLGLFGVPAYVVEDEVFYGRQHLPMIRWILAGRTGPVPI